MVTVADILLIDQTCHQLLVKEKQVPEVRQFHQITASHAMVYANQRGG